MIFTKCPLSMEICVVLLINLHAILNEHQRNKGATNGIKMRYQKAERALKKDSPCLRCHLVSLHNCIMDIGNENP